jgi:hypothetical protein
MAWYEKRVETRFRLPCGKRVSTRFLYQAVNSIHYFDTAAGYGATEQLRHGRGPFPAGGAAGHQNRCAAPFSRVDRAARFLTGVFCHLAVALFAAQYICFSQIFLHLC